MAILSFQKPDQVLMLHIDNFKGVFEFRPLEPGYGITIGNALRRVLLSSLEGYAITSVKIEGVEHEFSAIDGVVEDVTDIILNLKQVRFKRQITDVEEETARIVVGGQETFTAGDMNKFLNHFQVLNPDLVICNMDKSVKLVLEIRIRKGRGYVPSDDNKDPNAPMGTIAIDSIHTPIRNVSYQVDNYRVEQKTDYEKLTITVETDGSIHPKDALREAAHILIHHFILFSDEKIVLDPDVKEAAEEFDESTQQLRELLKTKLVDLNLSVRALNCLKAADVETLGDLVSHSKADLLKFRNFGKKSLTELEQLVASKGLEFGMKVDKYKLDKD
ncbi:MAG: DNA-directed RNA polymerase subunit alpha [Bacteroidales bacterium]|jgi:DNA-directed RNA polymerase subunit alpha|nr:DNA-directed RNA polymerase subunit alpha [Bacteroidales bacterium]NPV36700.1 DNA-directed RNA polymerase subunit alpha [Bacteroidales bacterium]